MYIVIIECHLWAAAKDISYFLFSVVPYKTKTNLQRVHDFPSNEIHAITNLNSSPRNTS